MCAVLVVVLFDLVITIKDECRVHLNDDSICIGL